MERFSLKESKRTPNFIGSWLIDSTTICNVLIYYFDSNIEKQKKGISIGGCNSEVKDSVDITIMPKEINSPGNEVFSKYFLSLYKCFEDYIVQWPFLEQIGQNLEIGEFNLQRYKPGQHFKNIHTERFSISCLHRVFAFMTYLNNV